MAYLTPGLRARYEARITRIEAQILALDSALANFDETKGYAFDSGTGRQQVTYRSALELQTAIRQLESDLDYYQGRLAGTGLVALTLRR